MINSRKIADLDVRPMEICLRHVEACAASGIELLITSTYRDEESQAALYAIGRTKELSRLRVTNAKPGESWHQYRVAYDVVPLVNGKAVWNSTDPMWAEILRLGKLVGAERGPQWELAHFQVVPVGLTLIQAKGRFERAGTIFV
jgi:peptidoglycan L-alanyl-D-glutamate endopeptidase CwlK